MPSSAFNGSLMYCNANVKSQCSTNNYNSELTTSSLTKRMLIISIFTYRVQILCSCTQFYSYHACTLLNLHLHIQNLCLFVLWLALLYTIFIPVKNCYFWPVLPICNCGSLSFDVFIISSLSSFYGIPYLLCCIGGSWRTLYVCPRP